MLPFTKKSCAAAEMSGRRLYLTCRLTTGRGLNVRVTSLHRNEHVSNPSLFLSLFPFFLENFSAFESYRFLPRYDLFAISSLYSAPESRTSFSSSFLKKRKIIVNEKLVVVERKYRGLESVETEYIYAYVRGKVHLRLAIEKREKSEEYGRENGPDRKEMNCQHCLVI